MMKRCADELGGPDILVNNAGIQHVVAGRGFSAREVGRDHRHQPVVGVPHDAPALCPAMKAKAWGRIINTASAHSLVASPNKSAYVAAKHGIAGFTKTVALETATRRHHRQLHLARLCLDAAGRAADPRHDEDARNMTREQVMNDVLLAAQPTKRFVTPEQVAALALFLCRDEARVDHRREPQHGRRLDRRLGCAPMRARLLAIAALLACPAAA